MAATEEGFYLQDSRGSGCVGNDLLFWAKDGKGYTTAIEEAHVFTLEKAMSQHRSRPTDIPWPVAYIQARKRSVADHQYCSIKEALAPYKLKLTKEKPPRKEVRNCPSCGRFVNERQWHMGCPKCGWYYSG
jgi:hypothetical protein